MLGQQLRCVPSSYNLTCSYYFSIYVVLRGSLLVTSFSTVLLLLLLAARSAHLFSNISQSGSPTQPPSAWFLTSQLLIKSMRAMHLHNIQKDYSTAKCHICTFSLVSPLCISSLFPHVRTIMKNKGRLILISASGQKN